MSKRAAATVNPVKWGKTVQNGTEIEFFPPPSHSLGHTRHSDEPSPSVVPRSPSPCHSEELATKESQMLDREAPLGLRFLSPLRCARNDA